MPRFIDAADLRKRWDDKAHGPQATYDHVCEAIDTGRKGKPGGVALADFSIRNLFEELVPDGRKIARLMEGGTRGRHQTPLLEATNAVDTSAFSSIVGQLMFGQILKGFENPAFVWNQLARVESTSLLWGQKIPGVANLGDVSEAVAEGKPYPVVGTSEEYVETQPLVKRGFIVPVTREITIADNTGLVVKRCNDAAQTLGFSREKRVMDCAVGVTNNYKRNGTSTNTYLTSGAYINKIASGNTLYDWTDIEALELLFDAITDPNTGEFILLGKRSLLVPTALKATAQRIVTASTVEHVDNTASASSIRTTSGNPIPSLEVISSPYVKSRSSSASRWWMGDFQQAFAVMEAWGIEQDQLGRGSHLDFNNDIVMQFKGSLMDVAQVMEPRYVAQSE
jgi:hypothetical protein